MIKKIIDIGKSILKIQENIDSLLYDEKKILSKKDDENLIIKTIFDLDINKISFEIEKTYENGDIKKYNFFQTPKAREKQYCLVRAGNDINFDKFFGKIYSDFLVVLEENKKSFKNKFHFNYLYNIITNLKDSDIFDKENKNKVKIDSFDKEIQDEINKIPEDDKNKEKDISIKIIKKYLIEKGKINKNSNLCFFIPVIRKNSKERNIVTKKIYKDFFISTKNKENKKTEYCYCCGNLKSNIIEDLSFRTFGAKISMIYTTTTINSIKVGMKL